MIKVRKLKRDDILLLWLLEKKPDSDFLEYEESSSETYRAITQWCSIQKDLKEIDSPILRGIVLQTQNRIFYDTRKKAFVNISENFHEQTRHVSLEKILPRELLEGEDCWLEVGMYMQDLFTDEEWQDLEECKVFTAPFEIEERILEAQ